MLLARPSGAAARLLGPGGGEIGGAVWLDLLDPSDEEAALASRLTGLRIPTRADLNEIESSSRLLRENGVLYLSTPLIRRRATDASVAPVGLVLSEHFLVTVRYVDYPAFETYGHIVENAAEPAGAAPLLLGLLEAIVDRLADVLEIVGGQLDRMSQLIFHGSDREQRKTTDRRLRGLIRELGWQGDTVSRLRDSLLGLRRLALFLEPDFAAGEPRSRERLATISRDLQSLTEFDGQLTEKVHFLLDATLGLINVEQNNGIRILTVVSLVGIPPTLIASIYGMNFKDIPELNWAFGYWYALGLMLASVLLPLAWFKRMGWI